MSNNTVVLIGRIGKDTEFKRLQTTSLVEFSLAVDRYTKDNQGNKITDWIQCKGFGKTADIINEFVKKGDLISVQGSLNIEKWNDKNTGDQRSKPVIAVNNFQMLNSKNREKTEYELIEDDGEIHF